MSVITTMVIALAISLSASQRSTADPLDALVDVLVFGAHVEIHPDAYPAEVKAELERHLQRSEAYQSKRPRPTNSSELEMVYHAHVSYERRLVAVSDDPSAQALAVAYVDSLRPCYEWEGYHDCPEHEAMFAAKYQTDHPDGPFSAFLPLLAAHRWLCTAEAYEYEKGPNDAARARRAYEQSMATARGSSALLIRTAAARLAARARCVSQYSARR